MMTDFLPLLASAAETVAAADHSMMGLFIAFLTLTTLEIVLGIDNIVFISILTGKLPKKQRPYAMKMGLLAAMVSRIVLLLMIGLIIKLENPIAFGFSIKDLIVLGGGLFLIAKSVHEIHAKMEGHSGDQGASKSKATMFTVLRDVLVIDLVFSLDSVITAVGMTDVVGIMIAAVVVSVFVMMIFATPIASFVEKHPTIKVLALSFLILIGVLLVAEAFHQHMNRNYIYFAMGFALVVELINMKVRSNKTVAQAIVDRGNKKTEQI